MARRVAFVGASGTGKTTLARMVEQEYGLEFNPVGSRSVSKSMGFDSPYDVDKASLRSYASSIELGRDPDHAALVAVQAYAANPRGKTVRGEFQQRLQLAKVKWERDRESFVSDRTTVDDFAYTTLHAIGTVTPKFMDRARRHMTVYDAVFFCPMDAFIHTGDDEARLKDLTYHRAFELLVQGCLMNWCPDYFVVPGPDRRQNFVRMIVENL